MDTLLISQYVHIGLKLVVFEQTGRFRWDSNPGGRYKSSTRYQLTYRALKILSCILTLYDTKHNVTFNLQGLTVR